jgi:hypothetical protein
MHSVLFPVFGSAIAAGAVFTAALNGQEGYVTPHSQPMQVARADAVESEPSIAAPMTLPRGPLPSYVLGTGFHDQDVQQAVQTATYNPDDFTASDGEAQTQADSSTQPVKVSVVDHQGGSQIDDLAHRPDPASQIGEARA